MNGLTLRTTNGRPGADETIERHASAIDEVRGLHEQFQQMRLELLQLQRVNDQQQNKIEMLEHERDRYYEEARVFQRKLIRLCAAMSSIGKLSQEAMEIMTSVQEWEEHQGAGDKEQKSAAEIVEQLRSINSDKHD